MRFRCAIMAGVLAIAAANSSGCGSSDAQEPAVAAADISVADGRSLQWDYTNPAEAPDLPGAQVAIVAKELGLGYWDAVREGAAQAIADINEYYGYEGDDLVTLTFEGSDNGGDVEAQVNQIDAVLAENPTALCIAAVDVASCEAQLEAANDNGIPVLALDSGVESPLIRSTIATDNYEAARDAAHRLCEAVGDTGEIALVTHSLTSQTALDRQNGFVWEIAVHPEIRVAANLVQNEYESIEDMLGATLELHPDLKGIFCTNEQTATEVLEALAEFERTDLTVVGFDVGQTQREAVTEGAEYGLICQNPRGIGYVSVMAALHAAHEDPVDRNIDTGYRWIDQGTITAQENRVFLY